MLELLAAAGVPEALDAARSAFGKEERQRSSIYTTVETLLEPFAGGRRSGRPTAPAPTPPSIPAGWSAADNTLYLCAPAHDQRRLTPLFVSVVRQVLEHVYDRVALTHRPLDPPLLVVLDEAANIAPLADLDALAATAAGHGVQLVTIWHDLAQITARYGPRATTVVNNHRAKLFLSGISDPSTLDYASHPDRRRGGAAPGHHPRRSGRPEHHPLAVHPAAGTPRCAAPDPRRARASSSTATSRRPGWCSGPGSPTRCSVPARAVPPTATGGLTPPLVASGACRRGADSTRPGRPGQRASPPRGPDGGPSPGRACRGCP